MSLSSKVIRVSEAIVINRYDNGWMLEIAGRNKKQDWITTKTICNTEQEVLELIKEYNALNLDN